MAKIPIPEAIYSEEGRLIGLTQSSACGCLTRVSIHVEPYRTMVLNTLTDYALVCPYDEGCYRFDPVIPESETEAPYFILRAKSALDETIWVTIGEAHKNEMGQYIFSLVRIRPQYKRTKKRHQARKVVHQKTR